MLPYSWYILKVIICSGILFGYYWLFLRNKIFHQYNRFYLLAALALSLLLPLVKIDFWNDSSQSQVIRALRVVSASDEYMNNVIITANKDNWSVQQLYPIVYWMVSLVFLVVLLQTLFVIRSLLKKYPVQLIDKFSFVNTDDKSTPFSFLKYIFWNANIDMETTTGKQIFKHEVAHIQEKHTYDKLFINIILVFFWCNPFFWLYRKELNMIHEFIADKKAVEDSDTASFAAMILQAAYPQHRFQLTNNFFYSPIKRRLLMLTKKNNPKVSYFARVMVLPLAALIFAAFTFKAKSNTSFYHGKKITVVIDAGHGGQDAGVKSADGTLEKDLTRSIAQKIKELNSNEAIEIILTKESDIFLSKEKKIEFVKNQNPSLYISLHTDKGAENESGMRVLIAKDGFPYSNQGRMFGSAILNEFIGNYDLPVSPQLVQQHLWTLEQNPCPSVYIETGLISNQKDLSYLQSEQGKETIAKNVLAAIEKFAASATQGRTVQNEPPVADTVPANIYINAKLAGGNYVESNDFKNNALIIVDSKQIGNNGFKSVEKNISSYSSMVVYNPENAKKIYGEKGRFGAIKLTQKEATSITADSVFYDEKGKSVKLSGANTTIKGNLSDALIYIENKIASPAELNALSPAKISSINILQGDKLDDIVEAKGKKSVIYVSLKPADMQEVVVTGYPIKKETAPVISLDKMNVLYVGVENPITIGSWPDVKPEDLVVYISPGTITGGNGKYMVTVPPVERVTITVSNRNGTKIPVPFNFRVKRKPDPVDGNVPTDLDIKPRTDSNHLQFIKVRPLIPTQAKLDHDNNQTTYVAEGRPIAAQNEVQPQQNNIVFTKMEVSPGFTGGQAAWRNYLEKNLNSAAPVDEGWKAGKYTLIVKFIVHTDGTVSDVTTENYKGTKTALECIRVIKNSPKWQPAVQNGRKVNAYKKQPITFLIEEQ